MQDNLTLPVILQGYGRVLVAIEGARRVAAFLAQQPATSRLLYTPVVILGHGSFGSTRRTS